MVKIPPDTNLLHSYCHSNLPWWKGLAELIDNAIDAGAKQIKIAVKDRVLTVSDDGRGAADIMALFKLGKHQEHDPDRSVIGVYGVGAKDAWLACADEMTVTTVHGGMKSTHTVDVRKWAASEDWDVGDPTVEPTTEPSGTTIRLPLRPKKNVPSIDVYSELEAVFTPGLLAGIQILKHSDRSRVPLRPVLMPARDCCVVDTFSVEGKIVSIDIGILPDGVKFDRGPFWIQYRHRVIVRGSSLGASSYPVSRMAGTITLGAGWKLSKNKDDLSDYSEELEREIFTRIEHVLQQAEQRAQSQEMQEIRRELESLLNAALAGSDMRGRGKRKPRETNTPGNGIKPKGSGRRHRKASNVTEDDTGGITSKRSKITPDFEDMDGMKIGRYDPTGRRVYLNSLHPFIHAMKSNAHVLCACATAIVSDFDCRHDGDQSVLGFDYDSFEDAMGRTLARLYVTEGTDNGK